jgi:hypothetical protein
VRIRTLLISFEYASAHSTPDPLDVPVAGEPVAAGQEMIDPRRANVLRDDTQISRQLNSACVS